MMAILALKTMSVPMVSVLVLPGPVLQLLPARSLECATLTLAFASMLTKTMDFLAVMVTHVLSAIPAKLESVPLELLRPVMPTINASSLVPATPPLEIVNMPQEPMDLAALMATSATSTLAKTVLVLLPLP